MSDRFANALIAILIGCGLATLLFAPVAAVRYRRSGRLPASDLLVLLGAAIYGVALWTYTLLPLPDGPYRCTEAQLHAFSFVPDLSQRLGTLGPRGLVRDPVFLQLALNVLLFVPLGYFVRRIAGRGVLVTGLLGAGISVLIETTQLTGLWGLYACSYRFFDVDDIITNTTGALVGAVLAHVLVWRRHRRLPPPERISAGRRLVGMACDGLLILITGTSAAIAYRGYCLYVADLPLDRIDARVQSALQWGVPGLVEAILVLGAGRTFGDLVVNVRTVRTGTGSARPGPIARAIKLVGGVGGLIALGWADFPGATLVLWLFLAVTLLAALPGDHRGLSHLLAGLRLEVAPRAEPLDDEDLGGTRRRAGGW